MAAITPIAQITYQNRDVSSDFEPLVKSITYTDSIEGKASSIDLTLRNDSGLFLEPWYPQVDDEVTIQIGYAGEAMLDAGAFWIDEVGLSGSSSGDTCSMRGISLKGAAMNASKNTQCYDGDEVKDIVGKIAQRLGCTVEGDTKGTYSGTQKNESDLAFLKRLASETGRILKIEGKKLIFYKLADLYNGITLAIDKSDVTSYSIKDKSEGRISKCTCRWWNSDTKQTIEGSHNTGVKGGAEIVIQEEVTSASEAEQKAADYCSERAKKGVEISLSMVGDTRFKSGIKVSLSNFGKFTGDYYIAEATHSFGGGYTTSLNLKQWLK